MTRTSASGSGKKKARAPPNPPAPKNQSTASPAPKTSKLSSEPSECPSYKTLDKNASAAARELGKSKNTIAIYQGHLKRLREFLKTFSQHEEVQETAYRMQMEAAMQPQDEIEDGSDDPEDTLGPIEMPHDFPEALDGPPRECTPAAIRLFLYKKCFIDNCGSGVADQINAAAIWHYDELDGDVYRSHWHFDAVARQWVGNPARSAKVTSLLKAIKNKGGEIERKHSRAMSIEDMERLYEYRAIRMGELKGRSDTKSRAERVRLTMFGAFATLAFTLWTRNAETTELTMDSFNFSPPPKRCSNGKQYSYFVVNLRNRKNWQRKQKKGETQLNGHIYHIYPKPQSPAIDAYAHVLEWKQIYEDELLGRKLNGADLMFPTVDANLLPHTFEPIGSHTIQKMINEIATQANLTGAGTYTTHCFRRGGAQYRFMFAPLGQRWTLARIRWWGGWTLSEKGDTLVRYLLDELSTYEEDHCDALCPFDESERRQHIGEDCETRPITAAEGRQILAAFEENSRFLRDLSTQVSALKQPSYSQGVGSFIEFNFESTKPCSSNVWKPNAQIPSTQSHPMYSESPSIGPSYHVPPSLPSLPPNYQRNVPFYQPYNMHPTFHPYQSAAQRPRPTPIPLPLNPQESAFLVVPPEADAPAPSTTASYGKVACNPIPRGDRSRKNASLAWVQVIHDWETSSPTCPVPLKDFDLTWCKDSNQRVKYHIRRVIALEFIDRFHRDRTAFCQAYPEHVRGITPLYKAILAVHQQAGTAKVRAGSRKSSLGLTI